jgi:hypothetical protein
MAGAANYTTDDLNSLIDILEVKLLLRSKGWETVTNLFAEWAVKNNRLLHLQKSLELKFQQVQVAFFYYFSIVLCAAHKDPKANW